jgi:hypothetical protein
MQVFSMGYSQEKRQKCRFVLVATHLLPSLAGERARQVRIRETGEELTK